MHALHQEILSPSGVEFAAWVKITATEGIQSNLIVARSNLLRIFEVREEKFHHIRTHRLHGIVTGLEGVKVVGSLEDGRDRLLVGFKDAKIALLEWSDTLYDFTTVSIHTYERAPQCLDIKPSFRSLLRVDPNSRCAALLLPQDALAVLPFHQHEELIHPTQGDQMDIDAEGGSRSGVPYFPSYILDLPQSVSSSIHNIVDFVFLPGFHNPTIAVLFNERPTWTGRLKEAKDTCGLIIFSMSNSFSSWGGMSSAFTVITNIANLPYDCFALVPCTAGIAGLVILTPNSVVYVDQATKKLMLPVNGWATRVSDVAVVPVSAAAQTRDLALEGSRATFISETTLILVLADGDAYTVMLAMDGKTVSGLSISDKPLAKTTIPSLSMTVTTTSLPTPHAGGDMDGENNPYVFIGSTQGPSVLLRTSMIEESDFDTEMIEGNDATGEEEEDIYDDADIYGPSHTSALDIKRKEARQQTEKKRKFKLQLLLADHLPSYGSINDMVFGLTRNGDKPIPILIAATSTSHLGGFTLFQRDLPVKITKKRMHILGGTKGLWSFALQKKVEKDKGSGNGGSSNGGDTKDIVMVISTDANPSPGFSRITIAPSTSSAPSIANISNNDITARIQGTSIGAGPFFGGMVVLQVMTGSIRVLESDGTERQVIKDVESSSSTVSTPRAKIRACSISDPYVMILREDDTMGLFIGEAIKGKLRRKDMSMLGGKTSKYLTGCFFIDHTGMLEKNISSTNSKVDLGQRSSDGLNNQWLLLVRPQGILELWTLPKMTLAFSIGTPFATLENVLVDSGEGVASSVPVSTATATTATSTTAVASTPAPSAAQSAPAMLQTQTQDVTMTPVESEAGDVGATTHNKEKVQPMYHTKETDGRDAGAIDQVLVAPLGETRPELHLFVLLRSGQLAIYQAIPAPVSSHLSASSVLETPNGVESASPIAATPSSTSPPSSRTAHLRIGFVKVLSKTFELQNSNITGAVSGSGGISGMNSSSGGGLVDQKKFTRMFIPFRTQTATSMSSSSDKQKDKEATTYSGIFLTGENPSWIIASDRGGVHLYPSGHAVVHSFTACPVTAPTDLRGGVRGEFLIYSDEGPTLLEWVPDFELNFPLPMRSIPRGRAYSSVVFDPSTSLVVAAAVLKASFASFDEDNNRIWAPDASNISDPITECSTLELVSPDLWVSMDGYEFATNEVVNAVACVTLETSSTETGSKDFIAVGTTINRGEDLAAKGATYIFEIVEVVADPKLAPNRWYKLRLRCRDDAKGPVTALCGLNGYLVSSMGQKIFVRAFDSDERLVGIAFMDVGVYVTSLRTIKNLLLIGDAVKSVSFVAFQEDPYKLILLAKDTRHLCVTTADFFFADNEMAIFTHDEEGILRLYDYNPLDLESRDGRYLLMRSEFNSQAEYRTTALIARRTSTDTVIPQAKLLCGATNGSVAAITPVEESAAKRLQLLQGQLTRNIQHVAGLNPRALRIVRNDYVSKPLSKGVLDANLLVQFENSSIPKQIEMTKQIGTEVGTVRQDWVALDGPW